MKRHIRILGIVLFALASLTGAVAAQPGGPQIPGLNCGYQCYWWGTTVACFQPIPDTSRCCYDDSGWGNACGEAYMCDECPGHSRGGF